MCENKFKYIRLEKARCDQCEKLWASFRWVQMDFYLNYLLPLHVCSFFCLSLSISAIHHAANRAASQVQELFYFPEN